MSCSNGSTVAWCSRPRVKRWRPLWSWTIEQGTRGLIHCNKTNVTFLNILLNKGFCRINIRSAWKSVSREIRGREILFEARVTRQQELTRGARKKDDFGAFPCESALVQPHGGWRSPPAPGQCSFHLRLKKIYRAEDSNDPQAARHRWGWFTSGNCHSIRSCCWLCATVPCLYDVVR